jgi:hypothetical protein
MCRIFLIFAGIPGCSPTVGLAAITIPLERVFNAQSIRAFQIACFESIQ